MKTNDRQGQILLRAGLWAAPLFIVSLLLFGALTPGYSHLHKAVSRLGALGTPWGGWFGLLGFFVPGMLQTGVALELRRRLKTAGASTRWATGLIIYTLMLALTAVPADFGRMFASPWTWAHTFFVMGSPLILFTVIPGCAKALKTLGTPGGAVRIFYLLGYLPLVEFLLYGVLRDTPGLVQRLMILTAHAALTWLAVILLKNGRGRSEADITP